MTEQTQPTDCVTVEQALALRDAMQAAGVERRAVRKGDWACWEHNVYLVSAMDQFRAVGDFTLLPRIGDLLDVLGALVEEWSLTHRKAQRSELEWLEGQEWERETGFTDLDAAYACLMAVLADMAAERKEADDGD